MPAWGKPKILIGCTKFGRKDSHPSILPRFLTSLAGRRYEELAESVEDYVLDVLRDQLNRRQPMDNVSRNLLRLLTATCGYKEVRLMAVQRLEMWLQNPKVSERASERENCLGIASFLCVFATMNGNIANQLKTNLSHRLSYKTLPL